MGIHLRTLALLLLAVVALAPPAAAATLTIHAPQGVPATMFLDANVTGDVHLYVPAGTAPDTVTLDGSAVDWQWAPSGGMHLTIPAPGTLRLHATLPGDGPWTIGGIAGLTIVAPDLEVQGDGSTFTLSRPARSPVPPWLPVASAAVVALAAAILLAWRDRRRAPPPAQAGLLDHLRELQGRLRVALLAVALLAVWFAAVGTAVVDVGGLAVPVPRPGEPTIASEAYVAMTDRFVPAGVQLVVLSPVDAVAAQLWLAVLLGIVAGLPVVAYEIGAFVGPALLPGERSVVARVVPLIAALFLAGAAFAWWLLAPLLLGTLYSFAPGLGAAPLLNVPDLVTFVALLVVAMGLVFELPVLMAALARAGVVAPRTFASKWRHAIVAIFLLAAIITPDPTVVGQLFVAIPMSVLYAVGVAAAYASAKK